MNEGIAPNGHPGHPTLGAGLRAPPRGSGRQGQELRQFMRDGAEAAVGLGGEGFGRASERPAFFKPLFFLGFAGRGRGGGGGGGRICPKRQIKFAPKLSNNASSLQECCLTSFLEFFPALAQGGMGI